MERTQKSSKETSKNGGSKRSSKSREPSEQVHPHSSHSRRAYSHSLLQKSKDSGKRKAAEKDDSDSGDDSQPLNEAHSPVPKTVKKVRESTRFIWAVWFTSHGSQEFPRRVERVTRTPEAYKQKF